MLVELVAGQFALESALADVANADPAVRDQLRSQLSLVAGLRQQIGTAQGSALSMLRAEVSAIASNAAAAAQDARTSASANASGANGVTALASVARQQTNIVMAGMKDFDPYLKFTSPEDEAEYRKREAERLEAIKAEQAKQTPQGDLAASHIALDQLKDAGAHGADKSPDYQPRLDALSSAAKNLGEGMEQSQARQLATQSKSGTGANAVVEATTPSALEDVMAALQAAGVQSSSGQGHGVLKAAAASRDVATSGRA